MKSKNRFTDRLSWLLDESITLPGGFKIGLDGLIGLIPGVGDFIGGLLSSVIIVRAHKLGVPRTILIRMIINMMIDTMVGSIPVLGDLFDMVWKANRRNTALLHEYELQPDKVYKKSFIENLLFVLFMIVLLVLIIALISWVIGLVVAAINS